MNNETFLQKKASEYTLEEKMKYFKNWVFQIAVDKEKEERENNKDNK